MSACLCMCGVHNVMCVHVKYPFLIGIRGNRTLLSMQSRQLLTGLRHNFSPPPNITESWQDHFKQKLTSFIIVSSGGMSFRLTAVGTFTNWYIRNPASRTSSARRSCHSLHLSSGQSGRGLKSNSSLHSVQSPQRRLVLSKSMMRSFTVLHVQDNITLSPERKHKGLILIHSYHAHISVNLYFDDLQIMTMALPTVLAPPTRQIIGGVSTATVRPSKSRFTVYYMSGTCNKGHHHGDESLTVKDQN